jgi:hypothetical protein
MSPVPLLTRLRYLARRAGWPALLGLALLGGAASLEFGPLPAVQDKLAGLRASIVKARAQRNAPERGVADAASLLAALPDRDALESSIAAIHQAAAAQGLTTSGGEYRSRKEAGGDMLRYEIALPLRGAYAPLRAWLAELAARQPAIAIDELSLHRAIAEKDQLEGRLRLALFLRARPAAPAKAGDAVPPAPTLPTPQFAAAAGALFAARSWQPPPPPPPPPGKPSAPPLPFKYAGKLIEDKTVRVFLTQGNTTTLVAQGDTLGNYDIERVTTSSVALLYRPLREKQTLSFGGFD